MDIDGQHDPVGFEMYGFTSGQVDAPETVFGVAEKCKPEWQIECDQLELVGVRVCEFVLLR